MPAREFNHLGDFCFRHLEGEYAANTHAVAMDMKHDLDGLFPPLVEESLENVNDKLHRRVVVVQDENLVEAGLLGLGTCLRDDARSGAVALLVYLPLLRLLNNGTEKERRISLTVAPLEAQEGSTL